jgi:uncharacterized protein (DUF608 family)
MEICFMMKISFRLGIILLVFTAAVIWAQQPDGTVGDHYVPLEKEIDPKWGHALFEPKDRYAYEGDALHTIGMPCGGICAGQLYVRGDGTLAQWWIANNAHNTGYGLYPSLTTPSGNYQQVYNTFMPYSPVEQGFAMRVQLKGEATAVRLLNGEDFNGIRFYGEYPVATVEYSHGDDPSWPVAVSAEVFSPFIPLNARDSAIPVTVLQYTLQNHSDKEADVTIAGWLQNPVMLDLRGRVNAVNKNSVVRRNDFTAVRMQAVRSEEAYVERRIQLIDDFETGTFEYWTVIGDAFGTQPVTDRVLDQENVAGFQGSYFANSFHGGELGRGRLISRLFRITERYLVFLIGAGRLPEATRLQLVVDGNVVRSGSGRMRNERLELKYFDVSEFIGQQATIEIVDEGISEYHHISVDEIYLTNLPPLPSVSFSEDHPQYGDVVLAVQDDGGFAAASWMNRDDFLHKFEQEGYVGGSLSVNPVIGETDCGVVGSRVRLEPGQKKTMVFFISWYFPNRRQRNIGAGWGNPVGNDGPLVGNMYRNWFGTALDVVQYVSNHYGRLRDDTFLFRDTYFNTTLPYWFMQRIAMPLANLATETCQWWANGRFWAWEGVGSCFGTCTHVWNYEHGLARIFPELERSVRTIQDFGDGMDQATGMVGMRGCRVTPPNFKPAVDGQAGTILKAYREHLMSSDNTFLKKSWPKVKKAMNWLLDQDEGGDGVLEGVQPNTYDIAFTGANTFVGSLYLAALKAGEIMARKMGDVVYADELRSRFEQGRSISVERLWNGEYFIQDVDPVNMPEHQYGTGCLSDQLFGQSWAHQIGLGYLYPEDKVQRTLQSIWDYNWAPHVGMQNRIHEPERFYAHADEPGLLLCTWPGQKHPGERAVRYRNEVWTGIEYQVASHMMAEGMVEEAFAIVRGIHDRYDGVKHNPWNEIECGDHYARSLASWGCLLGVSGFLYDGPASKLGFAPQVTPDDFRVFFTAAEGWGCLEQKRAPKSQTNAVEVAWGRVKLKEIELEYPEAVIPIRTTVIYDDHVLPATISKKGSRLTVLLDEAVNVERDKRLEITIAWKSDS